tara:strand:+ start:76 stop:360 length:285 start_codon:yes stop_codon:yes gene_type:complete
MNKHDIEKIVRWAVDSDLQQFSEDAYGITGSAFDRMNQGDDYLVGKFNQMQSNFIMWIAGLSDINRGRLNRAINKQKTLDDVLNKTKGEQDDNK